MNFNLDTFLNDVALALNFSSIAFENFKACIHNGTIRIAREANFGFYGNDANNHNLVFRWNSDSARLVVEGYCEYKIESEANYAEVLSMVVSYIITKAEWFKEFFISNLKADVNKIVRCQDLKALANAPVDASFSNLYKFRGLYEYMLIQSPNKRGGTGYYGAPWIAELAQYL